MRTDLAAADAAAAVQVNLTVANGEAGDGGAWEMDLHNGFNCGGAAASSRATLAVGNDGSVTFPLVGGKEYSLEIVGNPGRGNYTLPGEVCIDVHAPIGDTAHADVTVTKNVPTTTPTATATPTTPTPTGTPTTPTPTPTPFPYGKKAVTVLAASASGAVGWGGWWGVPTWGWIGGAAFTLLTDAAGLLVDPVGVGAKLLVGYPEGCTGPAVFDLPGLNTTLSPGQPVTYPVVIGENQVVCEVNPTGKSVTFTTILGGTDMQGNPLDGMSMASTTTQILGGVGGIAELPALAGASAEQAGTPAEASGWSAGSYAALAGGLAAAAVVLGAGWWYARRRLSRS